VTATAAAPNPEPKDVLRRIPLAEIHESPHNPRTYYDPEALQQLADSLLQSGQLEPVLVRPRKSGGYELAAGHRRFRAAKLAIQQSPDGARFRGLGELLAIVREMDDRTFIETLNVDNLQRDDLHPLEEANGFKDLMTECGYDVAKIAARIGKSPRYVYDSFTLLKLTPEAKKLFLAGKFERGHAIELARLSPEWQKRALDPEGATDYGARAGLWQPEHAKSDPNVPELELADDAAVKPVTVRELKGWVNEHVRATPEGVDPMLFPASVEALQEARQHKLKVIEITYEHQVPVDARDPKAPRIYGAQAWRSATRGVVSPGYDGKDGKSCEHAVLGVIVIGPGRGEAFHVCIAKEKCKVHWADWQEARAKGSTTSTGGTAKQERDTYAQGQERWRREEAERDAKRKRWEKAQPAILTAVAEKLKAAPAGPTSKLADAVLDACIQYGEPNTTVPRGRTAEDFLRHTAFQLYVEDVRGLGFHRHDQGLKNVKGLGIDAAKIVDQVSPKDKPAKAASAKATKSATKAKKGKKR